MTTFLRLLAEGDKAEALSQTCARLRKGELDPRCFEVAPKSFAAVPGKPFAYWVSSKVRHVFGRFEPYEINNRTAVNGLTTGDDFRFVRCHWEVLPNNRACGDLNFVRCNGKKSIEIAERWFTFAKGGEDSPYYGRFPVVLNWWALGREMKAFAGTIVRSEEYYMLPGLTWPLRARRFGPQCRPRFSIFGVRGYSALADRGELLRLLGLANSSVFDYLFKVSLGRHGFPEFIVGILNKLPVPDISDAKGKRLDALANRAWSVKRTLDTVEEVSHAFLLPTCLRARLQDFDPPAIEAELARIQTEIDAIAFDLYDFAEADRQAVVSGRCSADSENPATPDDDDDAEDAMADHRPLTTEHLLSWSVGVAFGRFDWRLATGQRAAPPEPDPFDPLPARSPGMLPEGAAPFHSHAGILVDDPGHPHDLARLVESALEGVNLPVPDDDEKRFETLQSCELELIELRDTLRKIAQGYRPNHDDGVQITAAPLSPLFRHKPWQKLLKDTWARLEKGDYDWAHLAMNYWPDRVREKCRADRSLAIAHDLQALYVESAAKPKNSRGKKMGACNEYLS